MRRVKLRVIQNIRRHRRAKDNDAVDRTIFGELSYPFRYSFAAKICSRNWLSCEQTYGRTDPFGYAVQWNEKTLTACDALNSLGVLHISGVINKARKMHAALPRQMRQQRMRANFVSLVGWVRYAVREKKYFYAHAPMSHDRTRGRFDQRAST